MEPEHFTLNSQEIIRLATDYFCVIETKKLTELPFHSFPNDLPEMAGGSQISSQLDC